MNNTLQKLHSFGCWLSLWGRVWNDKISVLPGKWRTKVWHSHPTCVLLYRRTMSWHTDFHSPYPISYLSLLAALQLSENCISVRYAWKEKSWSDMTVVTSNKSCFSSAVYVWIQHWSSKVKVEGSTVISIFQSFQENYISVSKSFFLESMQLPSRNLRLHSTEQIDEILNEFRTLGTIWCYLFIADEAEAFYGRFNYHSLCFWFLVTLKTKNISEHNFFSQVWYVLCIWKQWKGNQWSCFQITFRVSSAETH